MNNKKWYNASTLSKKSTVRVLYEEESESQSQKALRLQGRERGEVLGEGAPEQRWLRVLGERCKIS